jgi:hypothetical protein
MRILAVRWASVALLVSVIYAIFGFAAFLVFVFTNAHSLTVPFGVVAPLVNLNINLNLPRPAGLALGCLYLAATMVCYALTGWITGAFASGCFNLVARLMGGIDARFVSTIDDAGHDPKL